MGVYSQIAEAERDKIRRRTLGDFQGDNILNPLPRVLTAEEFKTIRTGVEQRINALKLFLHDHYSRERAYVRDGVIPASVIDAIVARHVTPEVAARVNPNELAWVHGPDIFRLADGSFTVVEDNVGYLGGIGDLILARETLLQRVPAYKPFLEQSPSPSQFYTHLIERYRARAVKHGGPAVLLQYVRDNVSDNEDGRVSKIFASQGVETVRVDLNRPGYTPNRRRLKVKRDGVYLERMDGHGVVTTTEKIGFVAVGTDLADIREVPGLLEAIQTGKVASNYSPGVSFIEDKEFHLYVGKLIRYYLHEEPILAEVKTQSFRKVGAHGEPLIDDAFFDKVFSGLGNYVIKGVAGLGGEQVWIGPKMSEPKDAEKVQKLKRLIRANPAGFIAQQFTPLSQMDKQIVDLRLITDVGPELADVLVADVPWGRSVGMGGDGKVNISSNGSETAVFVLPENGRCNGRLLPNL